MILTAAVMMLIGSVFLWWFHIDYEEFYEAIKDDNPDFNKSEICSILAKNDFKAILGVSFIFWLISPIFLYVFIGALMTFLTVKIPSLQRALESE